MRPRVHEIAKRYDAVVQVAEIPSGPPVLQTLVTEVYGPHRDGVTVDDVTSALDTALCGCVAGFLHDPVAREPVPLLVRFALPSRTVDGLQSLRLSAGQSGATVPLTTLVKEVRDTADTSIYHKNLEPVVYVIGDVAGATCGRGHGSPVGSRASPQTRSTMRWLIGSPNSAPSCSPVSRCTKETI